MTVTGGCGSGYGGSPWLSWQRRMVAVGRQRCLWQAVAAVVAVAMAAMLAWLGCP